MYNVHGSAFNLEWGSDDLSLYYTRADDNNRPYTVLWHKTCQSILSDVVLYEEEDERYVYYIAHVDCTSIYSKIMCKPGIAVNN